jgi:hypothetical protein
LLAHSTQSSLLVGGPGTAKTTIVKQFLARFPPETSSAKDMTFSYFTTPSIFQRAIEVRCALVFCCLPLQHSCFAGTDSNPPPASSWQADPQDIM